MGFNDYDIKMGDFTRYKLAGAIQDIISEYSRAKQESKFYNLIDRINDVTIKEGYGYYEYLPNMGIRWKDTHIRHIPMKLYVYVREKEDGTNEISVEERRSRENCVFNYICQNREHASEIVQYCKDVYDMEEVDYKVDLYDDTPFDIEKLHSLVLSVVNS